MGFDSLDMVELVVAMQENLGIEISDEDAYNIENADMAIEKFYEQIMKKINGQDI